MSDKYAITAFGREDFVLPFALVGFEFVINDNLDTLLKQDFSSRLFILDEDIIDDMEKVNKFEEAGANIVILKGWGKSKLAKEKTRQASIKAMGVDIKP